MPDRDEHPKLHRRTHKHACQSKGEKSQDRLETQGIALKDVTLNFKTNLDALLTADGRPISEEFKARLRREFDRVALVVEHIRELERIQGERLKQASQKEDEPKDSKEKRAEIAYRLCQLKGIGTVTAWTMSLEICGWRDIKNRRQLAALAGLVPVPYDSGNSEREQGISKSGRAEFRCLMIEIAWMWLYYQPNSELSKWYRRRFDDGSKRSRKRGIVALARKLLIETDRRLSGNLLDQSKSRWFEMLGT